jgi:transposase
MSQCPDCGAISPKYDRPFECSECGEFFPELAGLTDE